MEQQTTNALQKHNPLQAHTACIKQGTSELLNQQILMEGKASAAYLAMASWCDVMGYQHAANFLYEQSDEERSHMLKIVHYLHTAGSRAFQPEISGIQHDFSSLKELFQITLTQEIKVTHAIHKIVQHCWDNQDMATFNFMQWFVQEQIEEENTARRILELFDLLGETKSDLYWVDKEIGNLKK